MEFWVVCGLYSEQWSYAIGASMVNVKVKSKNKLLKAFVDSVGIKNSNLPWKCVNHVDVEKFHRLSCVCKNI